MPIRRPPEPWVGSLRIVARQRDAVDGDVRLVERVLAARGVEPRAAQVDE